jgi:hypothetical protein
MRNQNVTKVNHKIKLNDGIKTAIADLYFETLLRIVKTQTQLIPKN